ncbi:hypothetical protein ASF49_08700 [Methylobacterium sp. Leaf104]|nr:hypothetical protein ASF49_08700 [Methylobacterium sp. Leaf104]
MASSLDRRHALAQDRHEETGRASEAARAAREPEIVVLARVVVSGDACGNGVSDRMEMPPW